MGLATEHLFQFNSDLRGVSSSASGVTFELITPPLVEPISLDEVKDNLRIRNNRFDGLLTRIRKEARQWIEFATGQMFIEQTWRQIHSSTGGSLFSSGSENIDLRLSKARSIVEVNVWSTLEATSKTLVASSGYFLTGQTLVPRTTWPSTRGVGGFEVDYKVGHGADADDFVDASYAGSLKRALDITIAYLFENPGDNVTFESQGGSTTIRSLPPEALAVMATYTQYEL